MARGGGSQAGNAEEDKADNADYSELIESNEEEYDDETVSDEEADTVSVFTSEKVELDNKTDYAQELLDKEIMHGSGFYNGKFRIDDYVRTENPDIDALAKFLKQQYGIGGGSRTPPVSFQNHDSKGISLELDGENGEHQIIKYPWKNVAKAVKKAVSEGWYISEADRESRAKSALLDAKRISVHYEFPLCCENGTVERVRKELKACGIDYDTRITGKMFAVYASEALRTIPEVKEKYLLIDRSGITVKVDAYDSSEAEEAAKTVAETPEYKAFAEACRSASSDLISDILAKTEGIPNLGYPDEELEEFFAGDEALSDETVELIAAKVFGYRYFDEQRNESWEKYQAEQRSAKIQKSSEESGQLSLFDDDSFDNTEKENEVRPGVAAEPESEPEVRPGAAVEPESETEVWPGVAPEPIVPAAPPPENYHIPTDFVYSSGPKAKYSANVAAIKTLKRIEAEHRRASPEEQVILAQYSGWGGVADAFDSSKENWHKEYTELKDLLTEKEYLAARESTLTAFYTEPYIINSIYKALDNFGFKGGDVLDPAMGTGNFFGCMPGEMVENCRFTGVELDSITARIAKQLYPHAQIQHKGFERTKFQNGTFDLVIGNVPFGDFSPYDPEYDGYLIHDYFFVKSLDKLKPGGVMALITSAGTMDKENNALRRELFRKAVFIGGVRLPDDAFRTAGTQAVTDILFFQKLPQERDYSEYIEDNPKPEWVETKRVFGERCIYNENRYFSSHPEMVIGKPEIVSGQYGNTRTIKSEGNTAGRLYQAVEKLQCTFSAEPTMDELPEDEEYGNIPEEVQPYTFFVDNGRMYYAENRSAAPYEGKGAARIKAMCGILSRLEDVTAAQKRKCSDSELKMLQSRLNNAYDGFVKKYGYVNSRTNVSAFSDDVRAPRLSAIENVVEAPDGTITYSKADIFTQRTINTEHIPTHVDTALEAMHLSLNTRQTVDIEYISQLCGKDKDEVIEELGDRIYCNPAKNTGGKYSGWETSEEYLSGHVRSKLALAQEMAKENPDFERNAAALLDNQPPKVEITDIGFRFGTIYIPLELVRQFIYETFETPMWQRERPNGSHSSKDISIKYISELNEWKITNCGSQQGVLVTQTYGTKRLNAYELAELTLNQKRAAVYDYRYDSDGKTEKIFNPKETILARECQDKIEQAFHDWIMADKSRIETIETIFNDRYNNIKPRQYNGGYINVPGMNPNLSLRPHQKNVIARIAATGTCMMAHEVGAGKTAAMGAAGMYLKSIGACTKPMYVVPNAVVAQFGEELQRFFPEAKILAATSKDMEKSQRRRFLSKISVGNYDAIIIPQSQFEKIPMSLERQEAMYAEKLSEISNAIQLVKQDRGERYTVKALERELKSLETKLEKLRADFKKDDFITFEELGCDFLFVDEAHNYKNLAVFSKMSNVAGVNTNANSQKAFDMEMKCRYLQELHHGGGVVFATGTPVFTPYQHSNTEFNINTRFIGNRHNLNHR
ncbi:MAG: N-6 DNA methylase [Oscillospiraceae bacterium]|nr:N-6 DNA methylase [Oscillospiraceae bacterium]